MNHDSNGDTGVTLVETKKSASSTATSSPSRGVPLSIRSVTTSLRREITSLYQRITNHTPNVQPLKTLAQDTKHPITPTSASSTSPTSSSSSSWLSGPLHRRRYLKGFGRIQHGCWHRNNRTLMIATQTGRLVFVDAYHDRTLATISLRSQYVLACTWSPSHRLVAHGGLDNIVSVHEAPGVITGAAMVDTKYPHSFTELNDHHTAMVTALCWTRHGDNQDDFLLSASGDGTIAQWDCSLHTAHPVRVISELDQQPISCLAVSGNGSSSAICVSGGDSSIARIWDWRLPGTQAVISLRGHTDEIMSVEWMPCDDGKLSSTTFASCSTDGTVRLWDIRAMAQLNSYTSPTLTMPNRLSFSQSGRGLFVGDELGDITVWDTLTSGMIQSWKGHTRRVTCVQVSPDGKACMTASFDQTVKVYHSLHDVCGIIIFGSRD